ncbi:hypothetical protein KW782_03255 [Candidatus Parcubacteria bacterium]|nr:hypothetical protein [Candidatus Parcubacteria bacterium]
MPFKETVKKEIDVVVHGQTITFRLVKYMVLLLLAFALYFWKGGRITGVVFLILIIVSLVAHFFFRWKTDGWTKSWGLYKKITHRQE